MMRRAVVGGHFGEWLQGRMGPKGPVALVTLPCPALASRVWFQDASALTIDGPDPATPELIGRFLARLRLPVHGRFQIGLDMPMGGGAGASTATLIAIARAAGFDGRTEDLIAACLATEGASDPLMLPAPDQVLWASREGRVLTQLTAPPVCEVIGGFWGDHIKTRAQDNDFPDISDLVKEWVAAAKVGDLGRLAALSSASAQACTAARGPAGDPTADLARSLGALGWVRAHTGSARGLIFAVGTVPQSTAEALAEAGLRDLVQFQAGASA